MGPAYRAGTVSLNTISSCGILLGVTNPHGLLPLTPQVFHILVALADRDQHGYAIMQDVAERTGGGMRLSPGTLYGSIKRMLEQGLIIELRDKDRPDAQNDDERRRYYRLTPFGRKVVKAEAARLSEMVEQARVYGLAPKRG
jgi:DNA-binding PadR family transcriptional regulator